MTVGPLLAVLGFLFSRAASVGTGDVLLLFGFRLHLSFVRVFAFSTPTEVDAVHQYVLKVVFLTHPYDRY